MTERATTEPATTTARCTPLSGCGDCAACARWQYERDEYDRMDDDPVYGLDLTREEPADA